MAINIDNLPDSFGARVRSERSRLGISQERLALKAGVDRTYISGIERGRRNPSLKNIGRIAAALNLELRDLLSL